MGKTIVINGKTYSERSIDNIVLDGQIMNGNFVPSEYSKGGEMLNLDINVKSAEEIANFSASNNGQDGNVEMINLSIKNKSIPQMPQKEIKKEKEKETWSQKLIKSIIKFLNKFIS